MERTDQEGPNNEKLHQREHQNDEIPTDNPKTTEGMEVKLGNTQVNE